MAKENTRGLPPNVVVMLEEEQRSHCGLRGGSKKTKVIGYEFPKLMAGVRWEWSNRQGRNYGEREGTIVGAVFLFSQEGVGSTTQMAGLAFDGILDTSPRKQECIHKAS